MLSRWRSAASNPSTLGLIHGFVAPREMYSLDRCYSKVAAAPAAQATTESSSSTSSSRPKRFVEKPEVRTQTSLLLCCICSYVPDVENLVCE